MVSLREIDEKNWIAVSKLQVAEEQKNYVATPIGIMARAYAMRKQNARAYAIYNDSDVVGVLLVRDLDEEPVCYDLQQLLIDYRYQNRGLGQQALELIINILRKEHRYNCVEVCVKKVDTPAIHIYKKVGFIDTGYVDYSVPDSYNLIYHFEN